MKLYINNYKKSFLFMFYLFLNKKNNNLKLASNIQKSNIYLFWRKIFFIKTITSYAFFHPHKIPKYMYILIFRGSPAVLNKYYSIQKREKQNLKQNEEYKYLKLLQTVFISFFYFFSIILFFASCLIIKFISSFFAKEIFIKQRETDIDGVSFIIPTWNKKDMILMCIQLLDLHLGKEKLDIKKEIIIIENGSTDGSLEALSSLKTNIPIILLKQKTNLGFAKAINLGLKYSKYNYIYLINNDMEPQKNFFNSIINSAENILKQGKKFFGISSQIFFFDQNKRREESGKTYILPNLGFVSIAHYIQDEALKDSSITLYPGGGSSLINKHYLQKIGGYDHKTYTPLYCEDLDAGFIAWKFGLPSYFDPNSHVIHHHRSSSTQLIKDPSYFMYKNWLVLILKNFDSYKNIINHLFLYPGRIVLSEAHCKYAIETLKNIKNIYISKVKLYKYKTVNSDQFLINFPKFENNIK